MKPDFTAETCTAERSLSILARILLGRVLPSWRSARSLVMAILLDSQSSPKTGQNNR